MIIQQATTTCLLALLISSRHSERELLEAARNDFFNEYKNEVRPAGSYDRYLFSMDEANHNEPSLTVPRARFNDDTQHSKCKISGSKLLFFSSLFQLWENLGLVDQHHNQPHHSRISKYLILF